MKGIGDERGQVVVFAAVAMTALLGLGALAIDAGSWFHAQRQLQTVVDAAALAGAQDLPDVTSNSTAGPAQTTAQNFATTNTNANPDSNSGAVSPLTFPTPTGAGCTTSNCIAVDATRPTSGFLIKAILSAFGTVTTQAHAQAYVGPPSSANNVSAAALPTNQACQPPPTGTCTLPKTVTLNFNTSAPLLDLNTHGSSQTITGNTNPTSTMNLWITDGYNSSNCSPPGCTGALPVNQWYGVDNGQHDGLKQGFKDDCGSPCGGTGSGKTLIIPVYDQSYPSSGTITAYHVVGFAAFDITSVTWNNGNGGKHLTGTLTKYIATGLSGGPGTGQNFGVFVVGIDG